MKKTLITIIMALCLSYIFGQRGENKNGCISINMGASVPIGEYALDEDKSGAGYAKTGAIFDLTFTYKFTKKIGMALMVRGQANSFNEEEQLKSLADPNYIITLKSTPWTTSSYLIGLYSEQKLVENLSLYSKVLLGLSNNTSPDLKLTVSDGIATGWIKQKPATAMSFGYLINLGLKYDFSKRMALLFNVDYFDTYASFKDVETTYSNLPPSDFNFEQQITTINVSLGLGVRF